MFKEWTTVERARAEAR
jgi:uncharacterized protein (DUF3084 family)